MPQLGKAIRGHELGRDGLVSSVSAGSGGVTITGPPSAPVVNIPAFPVFSTILTFDGTAGTEQILQPEPSAGYGIATSGLGFMALLNSATVVVATTMFRGDVASGLATIRLYKGAGAGALVQAQSFTLSPVAPNHLGPISFATPFAPGDLWAWSVTAGGAGTGYAFSLACAFLP
jgi:hypothetical protein